MNNDESKRIIRLVGDGEGGGGIPLPPAFGAILERLADDKRATFAELSKAVSTTLDYKKARVFTTWPNWKSLTTDLLAQLEAEGLIASPEPGFWRLTEKVQPGADLLYIPGHDIRGVIYTDAQRRVLDKISEVRSEAIRSGVGNRDMDRYLDEIRNTVDKKRSKREFHAGSISPLDDEHGSFRMCIECGEDYELTEENFRTYKSRTEHYWNRRCTPCKQRYEADRFAEKTRITAIKRDLEHLINDDERVTAADVMTRFGLDSYLARKYWDDLASIGKVPNRNQKG
jgi:hypothetical protein